MSMKSKETVLSEKIRDEADVIGLDVIGFAEASPFRDYLLRDSVRRDPRLSLPDAKTIIVAGIYIGGMVLPSWNNPSYGRTSRLYLSGFFNDVVKPIEPLAALLRNEGFNCVVCDGTKDDGSIIPLKLAVIRAGLGWQGKHSLFISKKFGTFLALGGIITNADLEHNSEEEKNRCKDCDLCLKACPLNALEEPFVLNKKKCLSSLLQSDFLPQEAKLIMGNRVGDCEICQQACPWNRKHIKAPLETPHTTVFNKKLSAWEDFFYLPNLDKLSEEEYEEILGSLETGIPYAFFRRNVTAVIMERRDSEDD